MKIADLTVEDLQALIKETVHDALEEWVDESGPNYRDEFVQMIQERLANPGKVCDADEVAARLGLVD